MLWWVWLVGCAPQAPAPHRCAGDADLQTIEAAVDHLNTLPGPVDAPCIVRSLARPLTVVATDSRLSLQPAVGAESPRLFVLSGDLSMSFALAGEEGMAVMEFGQTVSETHTRKAEVVLPIAQPLSMDAPHTRIEDPDFGTTCAVCHVEEGPDPAGGVASIGLRPARDTLVEVAELRAQWGACGLSVDEPRCALLDALFAGDIEDGAFPSSFPTIFEL